MSGDIQSFVARVTGHQPENVALFQLAFTHSSAAPASYDRLEFLGDRVLGLTIAAALYERYRKNRREIYRVATMRWSRARPAPKSAVNSASRH